MIRYLILLVVMWRAPSSSLQVERLAVLVDQSALGNKQVRAMVDSGREITGYKMERKLIWPSETEDHGERTSFQCGPRRYGETRSWVW